MEQRINTYKELVDSLTNIKFEKSEDFTVVINEDHPLFEDNDYNLTEGSPLFFELDEYNRTSGAIAIISKNTLSIQVKKHLKYPSPSGWTKEIDDSNIFEKCHCIAYRLSARFTDKKNVFIGTTYLNGTLMFGLENEIENYIRGSQNKDLQILYRVRPIYKGSNTIPIGILLEAKGINCTYNKCRFYYNVEKNVSFDYATGKILDDNRSVTKKATVKAKKIYSQKKQNKNKNINFSININTKKYHLTNENCGMLKNVEPKYIIETSAKEFELMLKGYSSCQKCKIENSTK